MASLFHTIRKLHDGVFGAIEHATGSWLPGLFARFAFAAVLAGYYWNSAFTKVGDGLAGFFSIQKGAYFQMLPPIVEEAAYDISQIAFFPWKIIVFFGTYSEFLLPVLIIAGLFTRIAALGMIGFIFVQSYVDINFHNVGAEATGAWFDRFSDALILDQRMMWMVPLVYLVIRGAGLLSLDSLLSNSREPEVAHA